MLRGSGLFWYFPLSPDPLLSLVYACTVRVLVGCTRKQQTRSISSTIGTHQHFAQHLHFDLLYLATEQSNKQQE